MEPVFSVRKVVVEDPAEEDGSLKVVEPIEMGEALDKSFANYGVLISE